MGTSEILHLEEITSTSSYLKELQSDGSITEGFTVYADFQTIGRGQRGNSWESARGLNLMFSTILYPTRVLAKDQFVISQIVSLAIVDVLSKETSGISIKWPNDIYWNDKKITGILIENSIIGDNLSQSIIGVGLNLNQTVFESNAPNPISLKQITDKNYNVREILIAVLNRLQGYYRELKSAEAVREIKKAYKENLFRKNGLYLFEDNSGVFEGLILDVEDSGLLVVRKASGEIAKYAFKEIRYIV